MRIGNTMVELLIVAFGALAFCAGWAGGFSSGRNQARRNG